MNQGEGRKRRGCGWGGSGDIGDIINGVIVGPFVRCSPLGESCRTGCDQSAIDKCRDSFGLPALSVRLFLLSHIVNVLNTSPNFVVVGCGGDAGGFFPFRRRRRGSQKNNAQLWNEAKGRTTPTNGERRRPSRRFGATPIVRDYAHKRRRPRWTFLFASRVRLSSNF